MNTPYCLPILLLCGCVTNTYNDDDPLPTGVATSTSVGTSDSTGSPMGTTASNVDTGSTSEGSGEDSSTSEGGGPAVCALPPQTIPYAACEGLCVGACDVGMDCMVDSVDPLVGVSAAMCVESCTVTPNGVVGCSPTNQVAPFHEPTCQNFLCVIACVDGACPIDYTCVQVNGASDVDICMPMPLM